MLDPKGSKRIMGHPRFCWISRAVRPFSGTRESIGPQRLCVEHKAPAFLLDLAGCACISQHPRFYWIPKALRAFCGTRVCVGRQRLCVHFVVPAFVLDPKGSTEIMEHLRSHGPRAECTGIAREALRGNGAIASIWCVFAPLRGHWEPAFFGKYGNNV